MKKIISLVLVLALALTLTLSLAACGEKGPDVTGKYICVGEAYGEDEYGEPYEESWVELRSGGKGTYYSGFQFDLKWKMDGEKFNGTVEFLGLKEAMEGTLMDGVMEVTYGELRLLLVKEGMKTPAGLVGNAGGDPEPGEHESGIAGYYPVFSVVVEGQKMTLNDLMQSGLAEGTYLRLEEDGTGELAFSEEEPDALTYDEANGILVFDNGDTLPFSVDGEKITVEFEDQDMTLIYALEGSSAFKESSEASSGSSLSLPSSMPQGGSGTEFDPEFATVYGGDWHGMAEYYDCTGIYKDNNENQCEIIARFLFDKNGVCTPYIAMAFGESELNFRDLTVGYDEEYGCMTLGGGFADSTLTEESFVSFEDGALYIGAQVDDGDDGAINMLGCLRRLDEAWDYENDYPYLEESDVAYYEGMDLYDIAEIFDLDTDRIP